MNILCINTTAKSTQLAVVKNGEIFERVSGFTRHSEGLFPLLDELLQVSGVTLDNLDAISCVVGPGSFTGIRIGLSVAKGFAFTHAIPVIAVTSLELLAYSKFIGKKCTSFKELKSDNLSAVINAGSGLVYHQEFHLNNKFDVQQFEENVNKSDFLSKIAVYDDKIEMFEAISKPRVDKISHYKSYLKAEFCDNIEFSYNQNDEKGDAYTEFGHQVDYSIFALIYLSCLKFAKREFSDAVSVSPLYLRVSQAEQMTNDLTFRRATIDDLDRIVMLESQNDEYDLQWNEIATRQSFDNSNYRCYLACRGEEIKGMVALLTLVDEVEILRVVVLNNSRLSGVATKLLNFVENTLRQEGFKSIFLEVNDKNFPARSLYNKIGFNEVGRRPDYYEKGQDAIIMRYDLSSI